MKRITILGSTGSIGKNALDVAARYKDRFKIVGLTARNNISLLEEQIRQFKPEVVAVADEASAVKLREKLDMDILSGDEGIIEAASHPKTDFVLSAIIGFAGLMPTLAAINAGKTIGLANKESMVVAGDIVKNSAKKSGSKIIPVDSEHSAVFQCLEGRHPDSVKKIVLTASGGPFLGKGKSELEKVTIEDALKHPRWEMGKKITIDSATLMNKGLEVIEAHYLFDIAPENIDVLIHPQSIVHSMVEFKDRSYIAQLSIPDMRGPIAYALSYPERLSDPMPVLDFSKLDKLTFKDPDTSNFPCLTYAYEASKLGGTMPAVLNASNEIAVNSFLSKMIKFTDIPLVIEKTMSRHKTETVSDLSIVMKADDWARHQAKEIVDKLIK